MSPRRTDCRVNDGAAARSPQKGRAPVRRRRNSNSRNGAARTSARGFARLAPPSPLSRAWRVPLILAALLGLGLVFVPGAGAFVYWANSEGPSSIGRANLDGTNPNQSFITGLGTFGAQGMAVDGSHVYWANNSTQKIGRADLDGTNVNPSFITASAPTTVAVDGSHVDWAEDDGGTTSDRAGPAGRDGKNVNTSRITAAHGTEEGGGDG